MMTMGLLPYSTDLSLGHYHGQLSFTYHRLNATTWIHESFI